MCVVMELSKQTTFPMNASIFYIKKISLYLGPPKTASDRVKKWFNFSYIWVLGRGLSIITLASSGVLSLILCLRQRPNKMSAAGRLAHDAQLVHTSAGSAHWLGRGDEALLGV